MTIPMSQNFLTSFTDVIDLTLDPGDLYVAVTMTSIKLVAMRSSYILSVLIIIFVDVYLHIGMIIINQRCDDL